MDMNRSLIEAADAGNLEGVKRLIADGANVDAATADAHTTALMVAAYELRYDVCRFLISKGANVNVQNKFGDTALILAVAQGAPLLVQMLIDHGANVHLRNHGGKSAFDFSHPAQKEIRVLLERAMKDTPVPVEKIDEQKIVEAPVKDNKQMMQKIRRRLAAKAPLPPVFSAGNEKGGGR